MIPRAYWMAFWATLLVGNLVMIGVCILLMDRLGVVLFAMMLTHALGMLVHYVGTFDGP